MTVEFIRTVGPYNPTVAAKEDSYVQVGITPDTQMSLFWFMFADDAEKLGTQVLDLAKAQSGQSTPEEIGEMVISLLDDLSEGPFEGLWSTLTRDECNALIRALRSARNHAYGEDA